MSDEFKAANGRRVKPPRRDLYAFVLDGHVQVTGTYEYCAGQARNSGIDTDHTIFRYVLEGLAR